MVKIFKNVCSLRDPPPLKLQKQIIKLAKTSKLVETRDLQYLVLRNTCLTNKKINKMEIVQSPMCTLCPHPEQDSAHRFFHCKKVKPVWEFLSKITKNTTISHNFSFKCAIINIEGCPKNHPLILLTNYTRLLIDKAHINGNTIHPNTFLYKIMNLANIFEMTGQNGKIWAEISESCKKLLSPFNPQLL